MKKLLQKEKKKEYKEYENNERSWTKNLKSFLVFKK